jgi:hypothetical protein
MQTDRVADLPRLRCRKPLGFNYLRLLTADCLLSGCCCGKERLCPKASVLYASGEVCCRFVVAGAH